MSSQSALKDFFAREDFRERALEEPNVTAAFDGLFESAYALVAVVCLSDVSCVLERWPDWQVALAGVTATKADGVSKDKYLVFVLPAVPVSAQENVQALLNNTTVCRKLCVQIQGRTLEEALRETPFFRRPAEPEATVDVSTSSGGTFDDTGLSIEILDDLSRKSEDVIVEKLLNDDYGRGVSSDEDSESEPR